jgi:hypothetical protein
MTDIKWTQEGDGPAWKSESLADSKPMSAEKPLSDARLKEIRRRVGTVPLGSEKELLVEVDRLRARIAEHLIMFKSNDETIRKLRAELEAMKDVAQGRLEACVRGTEVTDRLRDTVKTYADALRSETEHLRARNRKLVEAAKRYLSDVRQYGSLAPSTELRAAIKENES